jgi:hypothetical protein
MSASWRTGITFDAKGAGVPFKQGPAKVRTFLDELSLVVPRGVQASRGFSSIFCTMEIPAMKALHEPTASAEVTPDPGAGADGRVLA